jgi:hypothetical protein
MTTPAQLASSSAAVSGSASSSGSGTGVTIAKDTVTAGTSVTGLAGVLAVADAADVADKIVQAVSSHIRDNGQDRIQEIRVIGDLSALNDVTALRILRSQVTQLTGQITAYADSVLGAERSAVGDGRFVRDFGVLGIVGALGVAGAGITAAGAAAGLISQLVTGTYTYSGQAIPNASVGGLDILIAQRLAAKTVPVCVDRFAAMPADSEILAQLEGLVPQVERHLNPALTCAASAAAGKAQIVADDKDRLARLDAQLTAAQKDPPSAPDGKGSAPASGKQQEEYDEICSRLPAESGEAAVAQNLLAAGQALALAVSTFVTTTMSAPAAGGLAPVARAAHGEALSKDGTAILYAQVIAAGDDQVLRQTLIHNTWSNLTGLTVEYALIMPGGEAEAFGLESAFSFTHGSIRKGLTDIARKSVPLRLG